QRRARRRRLQLSPPPRMAEAFVAQNPDCVQPNHPAQIRLKSGSSRATHCRADCIVNRQRWPRLEGPSGECRVLFCILILDIRKYLLESSLKICSLAHRATEQSVRVPATLPDQRALPNRIITAPVKVPTRRGRSHKLKDMPAVELEQ